ncbi:DUF2165 family protein [Pseudomonas chlororaphis]|uniref:DUF2165 family protein n=1 Tax=Pseudomonas chlororaphis TaxID=587753 RepID=UPI0018AF8DC1|nr:DUF2165 family protein [Pseudomonas chlororaphis]
MIRFLKILMVLSVGAWGAFGALGNLLDYSEGVGEVMKVMKMNYLEESPRSRWQRVEMPMFSHLAYVVILLPKLLTGILCTWCGLNMLRLVGANSAKFSAAKRMGVLGCVLSAVMLFFSFVVMAGIYFEAWRNPDFAVVPHHYASVYICTLMLFSIFLQMPEQSDSEN